MAKYKSITEMAEEIRDEALDNIKYNGITLRELCDKLKSNEYAPMVRGEWVGFDYEYWGEVGTAYACSECDDKTTVKTNYCPNCGAKMDGKDST